MSNGKVMIRYELIFHVDNKGKDIVILGIGPTQRLGEHSLTA